MINTVWLILCCLHIVWRQDLQASQSELSSLLRERIQSLSSIQLCLQLSISSLSRENTIQHLPSLPIVPPAFNLTINLKQSHWVSFVMIYRSTSNSGQILKPQSGLEPTGGKPVQQMELKHQHLLVPPHHNVNSDRDTTKASFSNSTAPTSVCHISSSSYCKLKHPMIMWN